MPGPCSRTRSSRGSILSHCAPRIPTLKSLAKRLRRNMTRSPQHRARDRSLSQAAATSSSLVSIVCDPTVLANKTALCGCY
jgi:hypothetical protein